MKAEPYLELPEKLNGWTLKLNTVSMLEDGRTELTVVYGDKGSTASVRIIRREAITAQEVIDQVRQTIEAVEAARIKKPCNPCPEDKR